MKPTLNHSCCPVANAVRKAMPAYPQKTCRDTLDPSDASQHYDVQHPCVRYRMHERLDVWQQRMERLFAAQRY